MRVRYSIQKQQEANSTTRSLATSSSKAKTTGTSRKKTAEGTTSNNSGYARNSNYNTIINGMDASNSTSDSRDANNIIRQQKHSPVSIETKATVPATAEMLARAGRPTTTESHQQIMSVR
jgi:hypothetical protein